MIRDSKLFTSPDLGLKHEKTVGWMLALPVPVGAPRIEDDMMLYTGPCLKNTGEPVNEDVSGWWPFI